MKIVQNNVKWDEIIIFYHQFYLRTTNFPSNFVLVVGNLSKNFVRGVRVFERNHQFQNGKMTWIKQLPNPLAGLRVIGCYVSHVKLINNFFILTSLS